MSFSILTQHSNLYSLRLFFNYTYDYLNIFSISHCIHNCILQVELSACLPLTLKMISMLCFKLTSHYYSSNDVLQNIYKYLFIL